MVSPPGSIEECIAIIARRIKTSQAVAMHASVHLCDIRFFFLKLLLGTYLSIALKTHVSVVQSPVMVTNTQ